MRSHIRYFVTSVSALMIGLTIAGCGGDHAGTADRVEPPAAMQSPHTGETGVVVGQMLSLRDRAPVADVRVLIAGVVAVTDAKGTFVCERVPPGAHSLRVGVSEYAILGGPVQVEVVAGMNDIGRIILDRATAGPPPVAPLGQAD